MKKIVSVILSLTLIIASMSLVTPVFALQDGDYTYEIINTTEAEITGYTGTDTVLTIPLNLGGFLVTSIGFSAFQGITSITGVDLTVATGLSNIGDAAFAGCTGLTGITLPDTVTQIGFGAFQNCTSLTTVNIGAGLGGIGDGAFQNCTALTTITVDAANTVYVADANVLFDTAQGLLIQYPLGSGSTSYTIPSAVTDIGGYAFSGAVNLASVDFGTSVVATIGTEAFSNCPALGSITIPDSVIGIGSYVFAFDTALTSAVIGDGLTSTGEGLFYGCSSLANVTFGTSMTAIDAYAFTDCTVLDNVTVPDAIISIGDYAFAFCVGLSTFSMGTGVQTIGNNAFYSCTGLTSLTLPAVLQTIGMSAFENCVGLTSVSIPNSVTSIGDGAFNFDILLSTVTIGTGLATLGLRVFDNCSALTGITVDAANTNFSSSVEGVLFNEAKTVLYRYPNTRTGRYDIPTTVVEIADSAFSNVPDLTGIYFPDSVATINAFAFFNNPSLPSMLIFGSGLVSIGDYAFSGSAAINTIYFTGSMAPQLQIDVFNTPASIQVYYAGGASGYTNPWNSMPTLPAMTVSPTVPTTPSVTVTTIYPAGAVTPEYRIDAGTWTAYTTPVVLTRNASVESRFSDSLGHLYTLGVLPVTNVLRVLTSIAVTTPPTTTVYNDGNSFDPTGMVVTGTYNDLTTDIIPLTGYTFNPLLTLGQTSITITSTSGGFTATTPVTVNERAITSIVLKTAPTKLNYLIGKAVFGVGEALDLTGGVLTVNYTSGLPADIPMTDINMTVTGYNMDSQTIGTTSQTVTITYAGFATGVTFNVTVGKIGDVNNDGNVTSVDALMALRHTSGRTLLTVNQQNAADVNRNAGISSVDALIILRFVSGRIGFF